ncbi:OLC1v1031659C1 [Oldenlandia corymbosa var. corymbosa]|uniref:OLC1v1031659C1 n=1 Tax=Oldenlandia corymbosa var. corymbosa TaxID=529605 RepID=A0AAV1CLX2_OLDCO|nr:OLC1v1031659C1 [Oldenlandia corymbosa var. corymbosa]
MVPASDLDDHLIHPMKVPLIDLSLLSQDSHSRDIVIKQIQQGCQNSGIFQVIHHGIPKSVIDEALEVNRSFFDMPEAMKKDLLDNGAAGDLFCPVKLINFASGAPGNNQLLQRDLLRLHANPLEEVVEFWPKNPADYKEKMGRYTKKVRKLGSEMFEAIMESLNLSAKNYLKEDFENGFHALVANCYRSNPNSSNIKIGAPAHSDHSIITILLQSSPGLQILDMADGIWKSDPEIEGSLQVFVGDHLEVLSNGIYKSVMHRAIPISTKEDRISIASFHSFGMDMIVEPAQELIDGDEDSPKRYNGCCARDIMTHIASGKTNRLIDVDMNL